MDRMEIDIGILFLYAGITILSVILFVVTLLSFQKFKNKKLFFVSLIFFFLFIRGTLLSISLFNDQMKEVISSGYIWIFDLIVLVLLYVAYSIKR